MSSKRLWACIIGGAVSAVICVAGYEILFGFPPVTIEKIAGLVASTTVAYC
jgi:hypothetical protein